MGLGLLSSFIGRSSFFQDGKMPNRYSVDVLVHGHALPNHKGDYDQEYVLSTPGTRYELQLRADSRADMQSRPAVVENVVDGMVVAGQEILPCAAVCLCLRRYPFIPLVALNAFAADGSCCMCFESLLRHGLHSLFCWHILHENSAFELRRYGAAGGYPLCLAKPMLCCRTSVPGR